MSFFMKLKKPVLSLTNSDYNEYGLSDLLVEKGDAYEINLLYIAYVNHFRESSIVNAQ